MRRLPTPVWRRASPAPSGGSSSSAADAEDCHRPRRQPRRGVRCHALERARWQHHVLRAELEEQWVPRRAWPVRRADVRRGARLLEQLHQLQQQAGRRVGPHLLASPLLREGVDRLRARDRSRRPVARQQCRGRRSEGVDRALAPGRLQRLEAGPSQRVVARDCEARGPVGDHIRRAADVEGAQVDVVGVQDVPQLPQLVHQLRRPRDHRRQDPDHRHVVLAQQHTAPGQLREEELDPLPHRNELLPRDVEGELARRPEAVGRRVALREVDGRPPAEVGGVGVEQPSLRRPPDGSADVLRAAQPRPPA
mmetsp:Transcript_27567/g.88705  ORF Transcript_27567/g.88705 Transcript_27567/m.88705 type:complete len:308 (-) Transcript_27567:1634-2557(-)